MASYNSIIGFQTLIEKVVPFFVKEGFAFHFPPYETWKDQEVEEEFYHSMGWTPYLERETNYQWFYQDEEYDSFFGSGYFSRAKGDATELIQIQWSTKKTVIPVFGIDYPEINQELNRLGQETPLCERVYFPFATIYHDMLLSTWSGRTDDVDDVFLSYQSDKRMSATIDKIQSIYHSKMLDFFNRGISEQLLDELTECRVHSSPGRIKVATLQNEEYLFWVYYLAKKYNRDLRSIFESQVEQIRNRKKNRKYVDRFLAVNKRMFDEYSEPY